MDDFELVFHKDVNDLVAAERKKFPRRRQVYSTLLLSPDGTRLCLTISEGAYADSRLNATPPQGEVEPGESVGAATVRGLREELKVDIQTPVRYLGSCLRKLSDDHKRRREFDTYHYHWTSTFAPDFRLSPVPPVSKASWNYLRSLDGMIDSMSIEKGLMCSSAMKALFKLSGGDTKLAPEHLARAETFLAA